jgi:hypothetical protein
MNELDIRLVCESTEDGCVECVGASRSRDRRGGWKRRARHDSVTHGENGETVTVERDES